MLVVFFPHDDVGTRSRNSVNAEHPAGGAVFCLMALGANCVGLVVITGRNFRGICRQW